MKVVHWRWQWHSLIISSAAVRGLGMREKTGWLWSSETKTKKADALRQWLNQPSSSSSGDITTSDIKCAQKREWQTERRKEGCHQPPPALWLQSIFTCLQWDIGLYQREKENEKRKEKRTRFRRQSSTDCNSSTAGTLLEGTFHDAAAELYDTISLLHWLTVLIQWHPLQQQQQQKLKWITLAVGASRDDRWTIRPNWIAKQILKVKKRNRRNQRKGQKIESAAKDKWSDINNADDVENGIAKSMPIRTIGGANAVANWRSTATAAAMTNNMRLWW